MNKNGKRRGREQSAQSQLMLPLRELAREALWDTVVISGLAFVEDELEGERGAVWAAVRASGGAASAAVRARAEFAGVGPPASEN